MPATPARIGFITREHRSAVVESPTALARHGDDARDTKDEPVETYFENLADAETMASERIVLLGERRRFRSTISGIQTLTGVLDYSQTTPTIRVIDEERAADRACAAAEFGLDFANERTTIVSWG